MARFSKTVDIWALDHIQRAKLQPGQSVTAGPNGPRGTFYGEGSSTVVAWHGNAKGDWRAYHRALAQYGACVRRSASAGGVSHG